MVAATKMRNSAFKILGVFLGVFFVCSTIASAVNYSAGLYSANLYSAPIPDTTPAVRTSGTPTSALAAGTTTTTLSLATNESATCRYSTTANTAYASMTNTFGTTGSTTHSTTLTGLTNSTSYTYYVRCSDVSTNANTDDYPIAFSVSSSHGTTGSMPGVRANVCAAGAVFNSATGMACGSSTTTPPGCTSETLYSPINGNRCPLGTTTPVTPTTPTTPTLPMTTPKFTRILSWKMKGADVKELQQYLNAQGFVIAPSGIGSIGKETTYFGLATKAALVKFQIAHDLLPATGTLGPKTRAFIKNN
jgi:hypothetical protein